MLHDPTPEKQHALCERLAAEPGGILEMIAMEEGVDLYTVTRCLPEGMRAFAPGDQAEIALSDIAEWGEVTVIVHTSDLVLECKGPLPHGKFGRGFFNLGGGSSIGGHIRLDRCAELGFVRRPFMGASDSCAITFFNKAGEAMFKIFVGRDDNRNLRKDQIQRFVELRNRLCGVA